MSAESSSPNNRENQLTDRFGRTVNYVRLSATDRCDSRCVYCMPEKMKFVPRAQLLTLEEMETAGATRYFRLGEHENTHIGFISPHSHNFCESCNRDRVTAKVDYCFAWVRSIRSICAMSSELIRETGKRWTRLLSIRWESSPRAMISTRTRQPCCYVT